MLKPIINLETLTPNPSCDLSYFSFGSLNIVDQALSGTVFLRQDIPANGDFKLYSELFKVLPHRDLGIVWQQVKICQILAKGSAVWHITVHPTQQQQCPLRAGAYSVSNFTLQYSILRNLPAGRYYLSTALYRNDVPICGAKVTFAVVLS
ncbi:hypothetical protein pipiens_012748 [Culex pipiens pipiens]|uniref:MD-2-related lipid-recognition domain-containing protein n=1 Tax=Culex pipiens pipiens TaxID=38569 RepID=A0ABD1D144_CULPP